MVVLDDQNVHWTIDAIVAYHRIIILFAIVALLLSILLFCDCSLSREIHLLICDLLHFAGQFFFSLRLLDVVGQFIFCLWFATFRRATHLCLWLLHMARQFVFCLRLLHKAMQFVFYLRLLHIAGQFVFCWNDRCVLLDDQYIFW